MENASIQAAKSVLAKIWLNRAILYVSHKITFTTQLAGHFNARLQMCCRSREVKFWITVILSLVLVVSIIPITLYGLIIR